MEFTINFEYAETYLPTPRCRKEETRALYDTCQVEIREITDAKEFPVAIKVTDYGLTPQKDNGYKEGTIELRYFEGTCWREWRNLSGKGIHELIPIDEIGSEIEYKSKSLSEHIYENADRPYVEGVSVIKGNTRDYCVKEITSMAKDYLFFDKKVWVSSPLPCYKVMTFGLGNNHGGTDLSIGWTRYETIDLCYFLADQKKKAFEHALKVAENRGDTKDIPRIKESPCNIEVLIPEAYTLKRDLASKDLPGYNWDDDRRVFVKEYKKLETPHDTWRVRFDYKYEHYMAKFCTDAKFAHTAKENIMLIVGQLLTDIESMPANAIYEIYNVEQDEYYDLKGNCV